MKTKKLFAIGLFGAFVLRAEGADFCAKTTVLSTTSDTGVRVGLVVSREDFVASPSWQPGKGKVPLSVENAIEIATKANHGSVATLLDNISLSSTSCNDGPVYWYYIVSFREQTTDPSVMAKSSTIGVLFSGKLIRLTAVQDGI
jgi:hypothetical protein